MRTPRIVILSAFSLAFFTLLFLSARTPSYSREHASGPLLAASGSSSGAGGTFAPIPATPPRSNGLFSSFSFSAPLSLFPPNAVISLTDDNTTAFHARPAAFGPSLPKNGMSGQLWIGSGFGDERLGNAGAELGCSDLPGWSEAQAHKKIKEVIDQGKKEPKKKHQKRVQPVEDGLLGGLGQGLRGSTGGKGDGTDDDLHPVIAPGIDSSNVAGKNRILDPLASHADIQSLQESAEIAGKVVLLQRGGCGFLEKVLWAQRRGGIAVIVGDDVPNRPLIQMYARGDTSNVTVPSVFTSRNTARMLSSLYGEGMNPGNQGSGGEHKQKQKEKKPQAQPTERSASWFGRLLGGANSDGVAEVDVNDLDISDQIGGSATAKAVKNPSNPSSSKVKNGKQDDGFVIGVQDWRDPDLVKKPVDNPVPDNSKRPAAAAKKGPAVPEKLPAADYGPKKVNNKAAAKTVVVNPPNAAAAVDAHSDAKYTTSSDKFLSEDKPGFLNKIFGDDRDVSEPLGGGVKPKGDGTDEDGDDDTAPLPPVHEGVWVTLTQTNGATPFFDTLLVLVVSPLITLTVVYAMLMIRSRIRRRRWRAPKSVVQQLPVRTFLARDTRNDSNASAVSGGAGRSTSPYSGRAGGGEVTPLLGRPRSRTTSGLPEPGLSRTNSTSGVLDEPKAMDANAKRNSSKGRTAGGGKARGSQWKKYMGRQVECVVCLEEYVDGVSRVMSLPCGHEFHVECITPWLTTRRRTCPICKGDVVRSLQRANGSTSPRYTPYEEDESDNDRDTQERAAMARNDSPSAERPLSSHGEEDIEQGVRASTSRRGQTSASWLQSLADRMGLTHSTHAAEEGRRRD